MGPTLDSCLSLLSCLIVLTAKLNCFFDHILVVPFRSAGKLLPFVLTKRNPRWNEISQSSLNQANSSRKPQPSAFWVPHPSPLIQVICNSQWEETNTDYLLSHGQPLLINMVMFWQLLVLIGWRLKQLITDDQLLFQSDTFSLVTIWLYVASSPVCPVWRLCLDQTLAFRYGDKLRLNLTAYNGMMELVFLDLITSPFVPTLLPLLCISIIGHGSQALQHVMHSGP